jgi:hypothetical protein
VSLPVTAWISSRTVAGTASTMPNQVRTGADRTARTTRPRTAIPSTLKTERPTSLSSMNG